VKKVLLFLAVLGLPFFLAACDSAEQGDYTPGVYYGYSSGHQNSYAVVTVDENGMIVSVLIDSVYLKTEEGGPVSWVSRENEVEGIATTKRALDGGCAYHMHRGKDVVDCEVEGELMWHQQVDAIAAAVVEAQELPNWTLEDNYFGDDGVAGVSITVNTYIEAVRNALNQAQ